MLAFLRRLIGKQDRRGELEALAIELREYATALKRAAGLHAGLGERLVKVTVHPTLDPTEVMRGRMDRVPLAQLYVVNLMFQACFDRGFHEPEDAINVVAYVLMSVFGVDDKTQNNLFLTTMLWRAGAMAVLGERDLNDGEEIVPLSDEQRTAFEASKAAGRRFAVLSNFEALVEPDDAEVTCFARLCRQAD